jgi:hypothetical protein
MPFSLRNNKVQVTVDRQRQVDVGYAIRRLEQGDLALVVGVEHGGPIFLNDVSFLEPRMAQKKVEGGLKGRTSKGVHFYVPQGQSPGSAEQLAEVDRGTMTLNAEGIAFAGRSKRVGVRFGAIESINHSRSSITIIAKNLQRLHFGGSRAVVAMKVQDRMYKEPLSGSLLRLLIEAAMKASLEWRR